MADIQAAAQGARLQRLKAHTHAHTHTHTHTLTHSHTHTIQAAAQGARHHLQASPGEVRAGAMYCAP